jgi:hypothetical protein
VTVATSSASSRSARKSPNWPCTCSRWNGSRCPAPRDGRSGKGDQRQSQRGAPSP